MRPSHAALLLSCLLPACAVPARFADPHEDRELTLTQVADRIVAADVVFLGELHGNADVHRAHLQLIQELHHRRPELVVSLEMFERDVQPLLFQYLLGDVDEDEFLADSRPWPGYRTDYRPLVEWCRRNGVPVIAANVPRPLAAKVAKEGLAAVAGEMHVARQTSAPEDEYWAAFKAVMEAPEMKDHAGGPEQIRLSYQAQCLKDDTMAESIVDFLREERREGRNPLVVHVAGRFHSDRRLGVVMRVQQREPDWDLRVLSADAVTDPSRGWLAARPDVADVVIVVRESAARSRTQARPLATRARAASPAPQPKAAAVASPAQPAQPATPAKVAEPAAPAQPDMPTPQPGDRPGLGFMPDYDPGVQGVRIATVSEGGAAAAAGLQDGDVIVGLDGEKIAGMEDYRDVLATLPIGATVEVVVERDGARKSMPVVVGISRR